MHEFCQLARIFPIFFFLASLLVLPFFCIHIKAKLIDVTKNMLRTG